MSADNENSLDIYIRLITQQTGEAPDVVLRKIKDAAADSSKTITKGNEESAESVKLFNTRGKDMHHLLNAMNNIAPGLGTSLKWALHPSSIGIGATLIIVEQLVKQFEKAQEKILKIREEQSALTTAVWEAQQNAIKSATDSAGDYLKALSTVGIKMDSLHAKEALEDAVIAERIKQYEKLREAMGLPKSEDSAISQMKMDALRQQRDRRKGLQPELDADAFEAERAKQAGMNSPQAQAAAAAAAWLEKNKGAVGTAQTEVDKLKEIIGNPKFSNYQAGNAREALPAAEQALARARAETEEKTALVNENARRQKELSDSAINTTNAREQNFKSITDFTSNIANGESVLKIQRQGEIESATAEWARGKKNPHANTVMDAAAGADAINAGGHATAAQSQAMQKIVGIFNLQKLSADKMLQIIGSMNDDAVRRDRALEELRERVKGRERAN